MCPVDSSRCPTRGVPKWEERVSEVVKQECPVDSSRCPTRGVPKWEERVSPIVRLSHSDLSQH